MASGGHWSVIAQRTQKLIQNWTYHPRSVSQIDPECLCFQTPPGQASNPCASRSSNVCPLPAKLLPLSCPTPHYHDPTPIIIFAFLTPRPIIIGPWPGS